MNTLLISLGIVTFSMNVWATEDVSPFPVPGSATSPSAYTDGSDTSPRYMALQQQWLFHPSKHQLQRERKGAITIYDGMSDRQVQQAFDKAFDRIDYMMFVNVRRTGTDGEVLKDAKTGEPVTFDDGC